MSVHVGQVNLTLGVGISTRDSASLVPGRNSDPEDEISLSYMDAHDGLLYSPGGGGGGGEGVIVTSIIFFLTQSFKTLNESRDNFSYLKMIFLGNV